MRSRGPFIAQAETKEDKPPQYANGNPSRKRGPRLPKTMFQARGAVFGQAVARGFRSVSTSRRVSWQWRWPKKTGRATGVDEIEICDNSVDGPVAQPLDRRAK